MAKGSTNGKIKQSVFSEESLSEDTQVSGKRKRNPPGQWWLSNPQSAEETEVADKQQTLKKSKQNQKELHAAASSPGKVKRDEVLKIRNRSQVKKKKIKPIKDKTTNKVKATLEDVNRNVEQEQQQDVLDQDLDPVQSSPSVFSQHSLNSGKSKRFMYRLKPTLITTASLAFSPFPCFQKYDSVVIVCFLTPLTCRYIIFCRESAVSQSLPSQW